MSSVETMMNETAKSSDTIGAEDEIKSETNDFVDLVVGGYSYTTARSVLLSSPFHNGDTYFHALLSGRWKRTKLEEPIQIPDQNGRLFFYVLYFLQVGNLPRGTESSVYDCLLSKEDIDGLEKQADFFGLTELVDLCKKAKDRLKGMGDFVGDLDPTPYSDFSVEMTETNSMNGMDAFSFDMKYKHNGTSVCAYGDAEYQTRSLSVKTYITNKWNRKMVIANDTTFNSMFERLKDIIVKANRDPITVTRVLEQVDIPPEGRLWYAFVINDMIRAHSEGLFDKNEIYDEFCSKDVGLNGLTFLFSSKWSCFHKMKEQSKSQMSYAIGEYSGVQIAKCD